jgi:hypothetical protein
MNKYIYIYISNKAIDDFFQQQLAKIYLFNAFKPKFSLMLIVEANLIIIIKKIAKIKFFIFFLLQLKIFNN